MKVILKYRITKFAKIIRKMELPFHPFPGLIINVFGEKCKVKRVYWNEKKQACTCVATHPNYCNIIFADELNQVMQQNYTKYGWHLE